MKKCDINPNELCVAIYNNTRVSPEICSTCDLFSYFGTTCKYAKISWGKGNSFVGGETKAIPDPNIKICNHPNAKNKGYCNKKNCLLKDE